mgnify:CR=1 FL=1
MTEREFKKEITKALEAKGYRKIRVRTWLFGNKADVTARGEGPGEHRFHAEIVRKRGRQVLRIESVSEFNWIDELEFLDAIFED